MDRNKDEATSSNETPAQKKPYRAPALVDWGTFVKLKGSWLIRANGSNVAGAAVDSIIFPTIAFGALMPHIVAVQFIAKVAGGAIWAWLLSRFAPAETLAGGAPSSNG